MTDKGSVRRRARAAVAAMSEAERANASEAAVARLRPLIRIGLVMAYVPLPDEVDVSPLLVDLAEDDRLVLPRVEHHTLVPHRVDDPAVLVPGGWDIREPRASDPVVPVERLRAVLVPGRAFDRQGHRLGRGSGFYDRFLDLLPDALRIGVAFDAQLVEEVPVDPHDLPVDVVVTPSEVVVTGARGRTLPEDAA